MRKAELKEMQILYKIAEIEILKALEHGDYTSVEYKEARSYACGISNVMRSILKMNGMDEDDIDIMERDIENQAKKEYNDYWKNHWLGEEE